MTDCRDEFLGLASPEHAEIVRSVLSDTPTAPAWAAYQQAFLQRIDAYVEDELLQPDEHMIASHEAGGQWRIGFPHFRVRGDTRIVDKMAAIAKARRAYAQETFFHGFPDEAEVHHEIETFIYFQMPLQHLGLTGADVACESVVDVAHHVGNWVPEVPAWYDWDAHGFCSTWLGTRSIRAHPPFDYQEANHFRFVDSAVTAYLGTRDARYLQLATDYADRWCAHIEQAADAGAPIPCAILPPGAVTEELGKAGKATDTSVYQVFYSSVASNTAYDVETTLLDLYRLTGESRYLQAFRAMLDQFFQHAEDGRPAMAYRKGEWQNSMGEASHPVTVRSGISQVGALLARMAVRHDLVTGEARYRDPMLAWAAAIDEASVQGDQSAMDVLVAAHYYTGEAAWLARAYAMDLRAWAVLEQDPSPHQCNSAGRYGSKFLMEFSYQPLVGSSDWGTRGGVPVEMLAHRTSGRPGLPEKIAFRCWRAGEGQWGFEALNLGSAAAQWSLDAAGQGATLQEVTVGGRPLAREANGFGLSVPGGASISGVLRWQ